MDPLEKAFEADLARIEAEVAREAKASHSMVGTHHVDARESYCGDGQTSNAGMDKRPTSGTDRLRTYSSGMTAIESKGSRSERLRR